MGWTQSAPWVQLVGLTEGEYTCHLTIENKMLLELTGVW